MSKWLTLNPEMANPLQATPKVRASVARLLFLLAAALATTKKHNASIPKPPQLNNFLTFVVVMIPCFLKWSASRPPQGTMIVISKCGNEPSKPVCVHAHSEIFPCNIANRNKINRITSAVSKMKN